MGAPTAHGEGSGNIIHDRVLSFSAGATSDAYSQFRILPSESRQRHHSQLHGFGQRGQTTVSVHLVSWRWQCKSRTSSRVRVPISWKLHGKSYGYRSNWTKGHDFSCNFDRYRS